MQENTTDSDLLLTGYFLGLKFREGWWFTHILETEKVELKPWVMLNEEQERAEIAPETAGEQDDEMTDPLGRRYTMPSESERGMIFQCLYGIAPSRIQIYPSFGRGRAPNLRGNAEPGSPQIHVTGYDSPYNDPARDSEFFIINGQEFPALQAYNPMSEAVEARLSLHINKLRYATVTDRGVMKAILQGQQPAKLHPMGLGAQSSDQLDAPSWLLDTFGDHIYSTGDVLDYSRQNESDNSQSIEDQFTDRIPNQ